MPQKFKGAFLITFSKSGQDRAGPKDRLSIFTQDRGNIPLEMARKIMEESANFGDYIHKK